MCEIDSALEKIYPSFEDSSRALESRKSKGTSRMLSNINKHVIAIIKKGVFICISQLIFVIF